MRPVSDNCPITRQFGDLGPHFPQFYDPIHKTWSRGRLCKNCQLIEPCDCVNPDYVGNHCGLDFGCAEGTPILAMADGTITAVGPERRKLSDHNTGSIIVQTLKARGVECWTITYRNISIPLVKAGDANIKQGDRIGYSGYDGSQSPYLHVELQDSRFNWQYIPLPDMSSDVFKCRVYYPEDL